MYNEVMQMFAGKIFENPIEIIEAFDNESFIEAFSQIENLRKRHYLLGYIRYEAKDIFLGKQIKTKEPLLYFEIYEEAKCKKQNAKCKISSSLNHLVPQSLISYDAYESAINHIKEEIACGNTYEVNYTYDYEIKTDLDGFELYQQILPKQTTPYNAYIKNKYEEILSFSPELFFELNGNKILTKPMKGTIKRGKDEKEDKENIEFLKNDIKNRAENVMIVDLLRNDLGKIAKTGTVKVDKLFEIETHKTLHQMTSEISAEIEDKTTLYDIFNAIYPCGSITGAPKINTMKIIEDVEVGKRGVYCGALGLISPEKTIFSVPIRILRKTNSEKHFLCRVGGAIVWDSTPEEEWDETLTKIKFLSDFQKKDYQLIETILVENGQLKYEKEHFERMKKSAQELGFKFDINNLQSVKKQISYTDNCILRVLLNKKGIFETHELPLEPIKTNKVIVSKTSINQKEPLLYHKTTHRPWYEKSMEKIKKGEIFDEIFFNENGELTEGARSNIILQIGGTWFTPPVECGLLNGVLRQWFLSNPSPLNPLPQGARGIFMRPVIEKILYVDDLKNAEKIFCINSVRGIVEVELYEQSFK